MKKIMNNLEKYNLKLIDNNQYKEERKKLYFQKEALNNLINDLNKQIKNIDTQLDETKNISMEIGVDISEKCKIKDLKINDKILFISYMNGYGIFEGIYERNDGYASVKDIKVVYHPNNINSCSHRVGFDEIIKIVKT